MRLLHPHLDLDGESRKILLMESQNRQQETSQRLQMVLGQFPTELISCGDDTIIKRGSIEIRIVGSGSREVVQKLIARVAEGSPTYGELCESFDSSERKPVSLLLDHLLERRIFFDAAAGAPRASEETSLDVYYWHFGATASSVRDRVASKRIVVIGVNRIARQFVDALRLEMAEIEPPTLLDFPPLRTGPHANSDTELVSNIDALCVDGVDCIVAAGERGEYGPIRQMNQFCVRKGIDFLPVLQSDMVGFVGPFMVAAKGPCYECFLNRRDSHNSAFEATRLIRERPVSDIVPFGLHPSISRILGEMAAFEITRSYGVGWPWQRVGSVIEFNMPAATMTVRKVLKIPRCRVCGQQ